MINTILRFVFERIPILNMLSGYKTYLGAVIAILVSIMSIVSQLVSVFPEASFLADIQIFLIQAKEWLETASQFLVGSGLAHKFAKGELR